MVSSRADRRSLAAAQKHQRRRRHEQTGGRHKVLYRHGQLSRMRARRCARAAAGGSAAGARVKRPRQQAPRIISSSDSAAPGSHQVEQVGAPNHGPRCCQRSQRSQPPAAGQQSACCAHPRTRASSSKQCSESAGLGCSRACWPLRARWRNTCLARARFAVSLVPISPSLSRSEQLRQQLAQPPADCRRLSRSPAARQPLASPVQQRPPSPPRHPRCCCTPAPLRSAPRARSWSQTPQTPRRPSPLPAPRPLAQKQLPLNRFERL